MQMVWIRLLAPKSPSFTFPDESLRMLAPGGTKQNELIVIQKSPKDCQHPLRDTLTVWSSINVVGRYKVPVPAQPKGKGKLLLWLDRCDDGTLTDSFLKYQSTPFSNLYINTTLTQRHTHLRLFAHYTNQKMKYWISHLLHVDQPPTPSLDLLYWISNT